MFFRILRLISTSILTILITLSTDVKADIELDIDANPDYRYRNIFGSVEEDLSGLLEVYIGGAWHTRTGLEFPLDTATECEIVAAAMLTIWADDSFSHIFNAEITGVYGFAGDGVPALDDVVNLGVLLNTFLPVVTGPMEISLPTVFVQELLDNGDSHAGLTLASEIDGVEAVFVDSESGQAPVLSINCIDAAHTPVPMLGGWLNILLAVMLLTGGLTLLYRRNM